MVAIDADARPPVAPEGSLESDCPLLYVSVVWFAYASSAVHDKVSVRLPLVTVEVSPVELVVAAFATEAPVSATTPIAATNTQARTDVTFLVMSAPQSFGRRKRRSAHRWIEARYGADNERASQAAP